MVMPEKMSKIAEMANRVNEFLIVGRVLGLPNKNNEKCGERKLYIQNGQNVLINR
jgi:hypothetical protein